MGSFGVSDYTEFLRRKIKMAQFKGFDIEPQACHEILFPHQRDIVRWAVQGGNRAIFASFGLHKTATQLEIMRQIARATRMPCACRLPPWACAKSSRLK